jgi:hypothetical protein
MDDVQWVPSFDGRIHLLIAQSKAMCRRSPQRGIQCPFEKRACALNPIVAP